MGREEELLDQRRLLRHQLQRGQADPLLQDHALRHLRTIGIQAGGGPHIFGSNDAEVLLHAPGAFLDSVQNSSIS